MSTLIFQLFGPPRIMVDNRPVGSNKHNALLTYIALNGGCTRDQITAIFWPESDSKRASQSLRTARAELKNELGDGRLIYENDILDLARDKDLWIDVVEFQRLVLTIKNHPHPTTAVCRECAAQLTEAVNLYRGDFMVGFGLRDSPAFDHWQREQTDNLRHELNQILALLITHCEHQNNLHQAIIYARQQLQIDNFQEAVHRKLMSLYFQVGQRANLVRQYEKCANILDEEFGIEPDEDTQALYQLLRKTRPEASPHNRPVGDGVNVQHQSPLLSALPSPYLGLAPFREDNARFFFGRQAFIERLQQAVQKQPVIVVTGASGSGKSSVVFAGLLPNLTEDDGWLTVCLRPGEQPFQALAAELVPQLEKEMSQTDQVKEVGKLAQALQTGEVQLLDVVKRTLAKNPGSYNMVLVIDQFEELYTLCPQKITRQQFIDQLLQTASSPGVTGTSCTVILMMRIDFLTQASAYRPLADILQDNQTMLGPMNEHELRIVIEQPARVVNATFEPGLVDRLLKDVGDEPGNLPLLEFTLDLLWKHQKEGLLTHAAYDAIGQLEGALTHYADNVYHQCSPTEQKYIRHIFSQMVLPGVEAADTSRPTTSLELGEESQPLIQKLADARLVVTRHCTSQEQVVEIVHEALIKNWQTLRTWLSQDRAFRIWQERLRGNLRLWLESQSDEDLLSSTRLPIALNWLNERAEALTASEIDFIERSRIGSNTRLRRIIFFRILAAGSGAAIGAALITALAGYILWEPNSERFLNLPRSSIVYIFGIQGGLLGGIQGVTTMLGLMLADRFSKRPSALGRIVGGMIGGGITGGLLFLLLRMAGALSTGLPFGTVFVWGLVMFMLASGMAVFIGQKVDHTTVAGKRALLSGLATAGICFVTIAGLFFWFYMPGSDDFLSTALGYAALEGMFAAGMTLGLAIADRLGYTYHQVMS